MHTVPYGKTDIPFDLVPGMKGTEIHSQELPPLGNVPTAIDTTLQARSTPPYFVSLNTSL